MENAKRENQELNLLDVITLESVRYMEDGELDKALFYAQVAVKNYPLNGDAHYNLAFFYEQKGEIFSAYKHYLKAFFVYQYAKDEKIIELQLEEKTRMLREELFNNPLAIYQEGNYSTIREMYENQIDSFFGLNEDLCKRAKQAIGKNYWVTEKERCYIGLYRCPDNFGIEEKDWDLIHNKGEFVKVTEGTQYIVEGNAKEYLLPIAVEQGSTFHLFKQDNEKHIIVQREKRHFNYYRVKNKTMIVSNQKSFYGSPIPLGHDPKRKKLVLNIFVDGLSQVVLNEETFERIMPFTYRFFKKGSICRQAYCTAEWTYPSLAAYATGLDSPNHMMVHSDIDTQLPSDVPTIAEYFKEAGYFTSMLTGNWREAPGYGYTRGYDQFVYQHQFTGGRVEQMVGEVIDHIEAFNETDQFLWLGFGDLHDVADEVSYSLAVQNKLDLNERVIVSDGKTSVRQGYNENKIRNYKKMISHMDIMLSVLWNYIEQKYHDEEIIVSVFADHGQGYLKPDECHFLAKERSNVAFMFRGAVKEQISDEIISTADYLSIMCKLAGVPLKDIEITSHLPVCFGGEQEREYAIVESIFPKAPYYAAVYTKTHRIYFENGVLTEDDCRFELKDYKIWAADLNDTEVKDEKLIDKYFHVIKEHVEKLIL